MLPKFKQLSVSIISIISVLVISLVVWLILVFFSVTKGLENGWIEKLVAITAPIRITPTEKYYDSYYYKIDPYSSKSQYTLKSIGEKRDRPIVDPYDPEKDGELPEGFIEPELNEKGEVKDLVKELFNALNLKELKANDYEVSPAGIKLRLLRIKGNELTEAFLTQSIYLASYDGENPLLRKTLLKPTDNDIRNTLFFNFREDDLEAYPNQPKKSAIANSAFFNLMEGDKLLKSLPHNSLKGSGVLAPKSFKDAGVLLGDAGYITYSAATPSGIQEMRSPIYVAGFYDPGIVSHGGKFFIADKNLVSSIRAATGGEFSPMTNGVQVYLSNFNDAEKVKKELEEGLKKAQIDEYFKVDSFRDFDFAKDLLQQLSSEKNIFSLIAIVIIIVACSNIVSMLIILVKDKRGEIGILRAMGASKGSIAAIFGISGIVMGFIGTVIGTTLAFFTLRHLNDLLALISRLQGYSAFNPLFYGEKMPSEMSFETLMALFIATGVVSLISGLIPAYMATRINPSEILRSE